MTKIIELAHLLGLEIAKSDEIKNLEAAKAEFQSDAELQNKMSEYEAERLLLGQEFAKDPTEADQRAMNALMADVNDEIKYCITGERPSECTHDCSTCKGCH